MILDKVAHQGDAVGIVQDRDLNSTLPEKVFGAHEIPIFPNNDSRDPVKQRGARAHDARAQSTDQGEVGPVAAASGAAKADGFSVGGGVSGLHAQVVATGDDVAARVGEDRTDGQATFRESGTGFREGFGKQLSCVHGRATRV